MYKCKVCGKEYKNKYQYVGHCSSHNRGASYKKNRKKKVKQNKLSHKCKYCGKEFDSGVQLGGHTSHCKKNPNYAETIKKCSTWKGRKHTQESKDKISKSRIKYLKEHPDKAPYILNHSSKISYPEMIFKNALEEMNIKGWEQEYRNSIYSYDFAWPKYKIDVEIDGSTHNSDKVKKIDEKRDAFSKAEGWIVIRFTAKEVKENVIKCINKVLKMVP